MIMVLSLFFMVRDGEKLLAWIINVIPMERSHKHAVTKTAYETFWAVTIGVFLTAAAQGLTAMVGFMLAGIRRHVLLGMYSGVVSLLGVSSIVCIPVALFVLMENTAKGLFLLFWGAVLVGWLDNILKPIFIGSRARMPFVLVFFSILGGVKMYGPVGLILGPVVVACVLTFIRIYRETYNP
jgi:predicted PurR-regulated permease PerM